MIDFFKLLRRKCYRNVSFLRHLWFLYEFWKLNGYWLNVENPNTYNEKINYRKKYGNNKLFSICSDKIIAKSWVASKIGEQYIIPNYYVGDFITAQQLNDIINENGSCFLKANHNSGPVQYLTKESSLEDIELACKSVDKQLAMDFGKLMNERWYSDIKPRVLVEKFLEPEEGESDVRDYKFHVFKQKNGKSKIFVAIDFDRSTNHTRSFFDEDLNYMHLSTHAPSIITNIARPKNYELMTKLAKKLAEPFSYVRVDFYNVDGKIYFGELTFAPGGGKLDDFESYKYDLWMGNLWQCDPRS